MKQKSVFFAIFSKKSMSKKIRRERKAGNSWKSIFHENNNRKEREPLRTSGKNPLTSKIWQNSTYRQDGRK